MDRDNAKKDVLEYLLSPQCIRERCQDVFNLCQNGGTHFRIHVEKLENVVSHVLKVTEFNYPCGKIPHHSRWRHFEGEGNRPALLEEKLSRMSSLEKLNSKWDLAIISVLLDAGAGAKWSYQDYLTCRPFQRSEGLALASFDMFLEGLFSSQRGEGHPFQVDAQGLLNLTLDDLRKGFQINEDNPLVGLDGRWNLLQNLGKVLVKEKCQRPSQLIQFYLPTPFSSLSSLSSLQECPPLMADQLLKGVLKGFSAIWPGRLQWEGKPLGDVWNYSSLQKGQNWENLVPFHKLSQWLTYSLLEPLEEVGIQVNRLSELTGLAEYRNGGLFMDHGVLILKDPHMAQQSHPPSSELVVEWRALTVILLDLLGERVRVKLGQSEEDFPLTKVLEGGTWKAGREMAFQRSQDGDPPLHIQSDGTVF